MSNYPMVDEVNRLVGNLLAAGSGVFLPGVGSLFVERRGARRLSKRSVQPPCRVVSFSSQQQGVSLADELARTLHCDAAGAQDVYDRWPADSSATAGVTDDGTATAVAGTKAAETDVAGSSAAGAAGTADSAGDRADAAVTRADAKPAGLRPGSAARVSTEPASLVSGHRYVVLGVFSTPENAARAAADAEARDASVRCGVYRFGNKFMVSPFEAPDAEACTLFIRNYSDRFPGLWTYTAR